MSPRLKAALQEQASRRRFATYHDPDPAKIPALSAAIARHRGASREAVELLAPFTPESMNADAEEKGDRLIVFLPDLDLWGVLLKSDWSLPDEDAAAVDWATLVDTEAEAEIVVADPVRDYLRLSRRATAPVNWEDVKKRYSPGAKVVARVVSVERDGLLLELERGIPAWMDRHAVSAGGGEFKDWRSNVVKGQGIEVVVGRFQHGRKRFSVEFDRDRWARSSS